MINQTWQELLAVTMALDDLRAEFRCYVTPSPYKIWLQSRIDDLSSRRAELIAAVCDSDFLEPQANERRLEAAPRNAPPTRALAG